MNEIEEIAGIRDLQKNWIGSVDGYEVLFNVKVFNYIYISSNKLTAFIVFRKSSTLFNQIKSILVKKTRS